MHINNNIKVGKSQGPKAFKNKGLFYIEKDNVSWGRHHLGFEWCVELGHSTMEK